MMEAMRRRVGVLPPADEGLVTCNNQTQRAGSPVQETCVSQLYLHEFHKRA